MKFEYDYKENFHNIFFFQQMNCYGNQNCGRQQWRKTRMEKQTILEDCITIGQTNIDNCEKLKLEYGHHNLFIIPHDCLSFF